MTCKLGRGLEALTLTRGGGEGVQRDVIKDKNDRAHETERARGWPRNINRLQRNAAQKGKRTGHLLEKYAKLTNDMRSQMWLGQVK